MLGLEMLDVAIGMTFIFLMLSLICTAVSEIIEAWWKNRAVDLERGIRELLQDKSGTGLAKKIYKHPLVFGLFRGDYDPKKITKNEYESRSELPSYIPSRNFALALMDIVLPSDGHTRSLQAIRDAINDQNGALKNAPEIKTALLALLNNAGDDIDKVRESIEAWYDSSMDRVSGWYKRRAQIIVFGLGLIVAIVMNADTIAIYKSMMNDAPLRNSLVVAAHEYAKTREQDETGSSSKQNQIKVTIDSLRKADALVQKQIEANTDSLKKAKDSPKKQIEANTDSLLETSINSLKAVDSSLKAEINDNMSLMADLSPQKRIKANMDSLAALGLPIGWNWKSCATPDAPRNFRAVPPWGWDWLFKIFGWLLTAVAVSLGAPFWFDVLNKFMVIRSTVKPHEKSPEEDSEDRQTSRDKGSNQAEAVLSGMESMLKGFNAALVPPEQKKFEALSVDEQQKIMESAIEENEEKWRTIYSNVVSLAPGNKYVSDNATDIRCIVFYVKEKVKDRQEVAQIDTIPSYIEYKGFKVPTDVQPQKDLPFRQSFNPPPLDPDEFYNRMPGCGVSRIDSTEVGSIGVVAYRDDKEGNRTYFVLSCFHVLCPAELSRNWTEVSKNNRHGKSEVVCPSLFDDRKGTNKNIIADIDKGMLTSYVDAAIAKLRKEDAILALKDLKKPVEIYELTPEDENNLTVHMRGRVTTPSSKKEKSGKVKHISSNPTILYKVSNLFTPKTLKRLIQTEKISDYGDSGGPVYTKDGNKDGKLIGIIVGGSTEYSYVIPIKHIMNRLDVRV